MTLAYKDTEVTKEVAKFMTAACKEKHSNQGTKMKFTENRNEVVEIQLLKTRSNQKLLHTHYSKQKI